jgi:glycine/D-amino acid oxidase-like deaminating enzyme/nitrite reductase/ring-hydroxylating ferredoxin subunit
MNGQTQSPWMTFPIPNRAALSGNVRADVCIIGAGIAGITTAYLLSQKGRSVVVLDDGAIGGGMTGRTTAHLVSAIDDRWHEVEKLHGLEGARLAAQSHAGAIDAIEGIVRRESIDCDFERLDGFLFIPPDGDPKEIDDELAAAQRVGIEGVELAERAPIDGFDTGRCIRFPRQGQFHPLKYLSALARAIERDRGAIHCGTHAEEVRGGRNPSVVTREGYRIDCGAVVVATNTPINDKVKIHTKQAPYLTYVIAARVPRGTVARVLLWDTLDPYHFVRVIPDAESQGEMLVVGGEDHKTGQENDGAQRFENLERWTRERFPMAREIMYRWSGQVMETHDYLGFLGRNPGDENVYVATGDSGMGMTHGTIAGLVITDLIHGAEVPWSVLYDPARITLGATRTFAKETANMAWQYTDWLTGGDKAVEEIAPGSGAVVRRGAQKVAVYRDPAGERHEMSAVCTHLGCIVAWNDEEHTWDCKCHGSRFDALGQVVSGPAVADLKPVDVPSRAPGDRDEAPARPGRLPVSDQPGQRGQP